MILGLFLPLIVAFCFGKNMLTTDFDLSSMFIDTGKMLFVIYYLTGIGFIFTAIQRIAKVNGRNGYDISKERKNLIWFANTLVASIAASILVFIFIDELRGKSIILMFFYAIVLVISWTIVSLLIKPKKQLHIDKIKNITFRNKAMFIKTISLLIKSSRITTSIISGVLSFFVLVVHSNTNILNYILLSISITIATMVGFILNDIYDKEKDKVANKNRPICKDQLSIYNARLGAIIMSIISLCIPLLLNSILGFIIILLTLVAVYLYSPFSKHFPIFKGFFTAVLCCSPVIYGFTLAHQPIPYIAISLIVIFILGRELFLDIFDFNGDSMNQLKTLPYYLFKNNLKFGKRISWLIMYIGIFMLVMISIHNFWGMIFSFIGLVLIVFTSLFQKSYKLQLRVTRIAMLFGSLAIAFI